MCDFRKGKMQASDQCWKRVKSKEACAVHISTEKHLPFPYNICTQPRTSKDYCLAGQHLATCLYHEHWSRYSLGLRHATSRKHAFMKARGTEINR